jgi:hypothetical protein
MSPRRRTRPSTSITLLAAAVWLSSCAPDVNVKEALTVTDVLTGWFDAGIVDGKNKLVPNLTLRLRNSSEQELPSVSINVIFKFADNGETHDEIFKQRVPFQNGQTELITVRSQNGFTGQPPQTRVEMLQNSFFRDMDAVVLVRQASAQWVELHRVRIERKLLTD